MIPFSFSLLPFPLTSGELGCTFRWCSIFRFCVHVPDSRFVLTRLSGMLLPASSLISLSLSGRRICRCLLSFCETGSEAENVLFANQIIASSCSAARHNKSVSTLSRGPIYNNHPSYHPFSRCLKSSVIVLIGLQLHQHQLVSFSEVRETDA